MQISAYISVVLLNFLLIIVINNFFQFSEQKIPAAWNINFFETRKFEKSNDSNLHKYY